MSTENTEPIEPESWDQRPDESDVAHAAMIDYFRLGPGRSLDKLHRMYTGESAGIYQENKSLEPPTRSISTLKKWSMNHEWQDRLGDWEYNEQLLDEAEWRKRKKETREADYLLATELRQTAMGILRHTSQFVKRTESVQPGTPTVVDEDGKVVTEGTPDRVVITIKLKMTQAIQAARAASQIARLAADIAPPKQTVGIEGELPPIRGINFGAPPEVIAEFEAADVEDT